MENTVKYNNLKYSQAMRRLIYFQEKKDEMKQIHAMQRNEEYWKERRRVDHSIWYYKKRLEELDHAQN